MSMTRAVAGNEGSIDDVNQIIDLLQGTSGFTEAFLLRCATSSDFKVRLSDAAGARRFEIQDSAGVAQAYVDSDGNLTILGGFAPGSLTLPSSTSPAQTTEGGIAWDSDDDLLKVGTGAATKVIGLSRGAGSSASATQELVYDTTAAQLNVWNGTTSVSSTPAFFDVERTAFRAKRIQIAIAHGGVTSGANGIEGWTYSSGLVSNTLNSVRYSGEKVGGSAGEKDLFSSNAAGTIAPAASPRFLAGLIFPDAHAEVTSFIAGFASAKASLTANGAYFRIATTGNVFAVTRQGGSETTTDLGALTRTTVIYAAEIETIDAGVTWKFYLNGSLVATHTTNVPTAATLIDFGYSATTATNPHTCGFTYMVAEATFA